MEELNNNEIRKTRTGIKIGSNLVLVLIIVVVIMLFNFFAVDDITNGEPKTIQWWIQKAMVGLGTFLIMIGVANTTEESLKNKDKSFIQKINSLDKHYNLVLQNGESEWLNLFLTNINKKSKYDAYIKAQKRKLLHYKKLIKQNKWKDSKTIKRLEESLLLSVEDVWSLEKKIKYPSLTFEKLVSGAYNITDKEQDENDVSIHRGDAVAKKLIWKILAIVGAGMFLPDIVYHFSDFTRDDVIPLITRFATILWAIYSGCSFGYYMQDRVIVALKKKLKKFSEFRTRTDVEPYKQMDIKERYSVVIQMDALIVKLKEKYGITEPVPQFNGISVNVEEIHEEQKETKELSDNALVKTIQQIDHPISVGQLANNLINNIKEGANNDT